MQINGPAHIHGSQSVGGPQKIEGASAAQSTNEVNEAALHEADQLDISPEADLIGRVQELPDVRAERIDSIRQQIEAGTYDTDEKFDIALGRMFDEFAG
jgi:flagellar biosynthesis anti-sigma factor FlgM